MKMSNSFALVVLLILLFCMSVRCGVFDDEATVRKARCYANCITMVSKIPINDSSCSSSQCLECTIPCDRNFESVDNCTQNCPNASTYCNPSCTFLGTTKNWTNIYQGNGKTIRKPGVAHNATRNVTTLTLSWQPSVNASGTVVYLLKEKMSGDKRSLTPSPLKGLVFLEPRAILTAKDACGVKLSGPPQYRQKYDGITFAFTVVALTEVSTLVEGQESSNISFQKAEPFLFLHNASLVYDPNTVGDKFDFRVSFTPSLSPSSVTEYVGLTKKTGGKCESLDVFRTAKKEPNVNRLSADFHEKMLTCNISFTAYSLTECLPSKPSKSIGYYYKGCHYHPGMNTSFCCKFDPLPTPDSAKMVRYLSYSLQTQSDFRFTANITWLPPTQPCPVAGSYKLKYPVYSQVFKRMFDTHKPTSNTYYIMPNIEPNLERNVTVTPNFRRGSKFWDLGVDKVIAIKTPGLPPNETIIINIQHHLQRPTSPADRFSLNISWIKPKFSYSRIEGYNVTYTVQGDDPKRSTTQQLWYVVRELDYTQNISYQVLPVYGDAWILTESAKGQASLPVLAGKNISIQGFKKSFIKTNNFYRLLVRWSPPSFQRKVSYYKVSYKLTGYPGDQLDCPSQSSTKRTCLAPITTYTSYIISNIHPKEQIEITVTPVFYNTHAFQGKPLTLITRAPESPITKGLGSGEIILLVVGILVFLAILVLILLYCLRWKKQKDIENGKVDRHRGAIIDHWEVSHSNLDLIEVIGEGAFGKVYKGMLLEYPEQSSRTGSSSMSFGRRGTIRSTRSSRGDDSYMVAVKMLHDSADDDQRKEFLKEIQLMKDVGSHRNIVNMLGCGTIRDPMFLIVEYLPNGDLLHFLRKRRGNAKQYPESDSRGPNHSTYCQAYFYMNGKPCLKDEASLKPPNKGQYVNTNDNAGFQDEREEGIQLKAVKKIDEKEPSAPASYLGTPEDDEFDDEVVTSGDLMAFAWQVAQGMEYLAKRGYVHRDLAARNVLVGNNKEAKIADFGLTRHMYEDLYRAKTNRRLPLKWMSIEAIFDQTFTSQSDVWAFGVLLWEIVTLGGTPYPAKTNKELLNYLKEGKRMEKPDTCDDEVYRIMMSCWKEKPEERPTFVQIREKFEEMMMRENPYFDPSSVDESRDYYNVPSFHSIEESDDGDDEVFNEILGIGKEKEMENQLNGNAVSDRQEKLSEQENHKDEFDEKELDIGDIEALLYRKQHRSIKNKPSV